MASTTPQLQVQHTNINSRTGFAHGPATIYNYKNDCLYLGLRELKLEEVDEWRVGGKDKQSHK